MAIVSSPRPRFSRIARPLRKSKRGSRAAPPRRPSSRRPAKRRIGAAPEGGGLFAIRTLFRRRRRTRSGLSVRSGLSAMRRRSLLAAACTALLPVRCAGAAAEIDVRAPATPSCSRAFALPAHLCGTGSGSSCITPRPSGPRWRASTATTASASATRSGPSTTSSINNGKKRAAGLVEAARWRYQEPAAHLFKPENAPGLDRRIVR